MNTKTRDQVHFFLYPHSLAHVRNAILAERRKKAGKPGGRGGKRMEGGFKRGKRRILLD